MNEINRLINECGLSKVNVAKYLGVSRQMLYNYLSLKSLDELPKDKLNKLLSLFGVDKESDLKKIKVDKTFIEQIEAKLDEDNNILNKDLNNLSGLNKKEQTLLSDIIGILKEKLEDDKENGYDTLKYLFYFLQTMDQLEELKYFLAYMAKSNCLVDPLEYIYNEDKQYTFEGILYSAMNLYSNGRASRSKVIETHKMFEQEIASKKEEKLGRTQELNSFKTQASSITEQIWRQSFHSIAVCRSIPQKSFSIY
ncbi:MAG: hypothetical protein BHW63_02995 [Mycoplasma sp. CAG:611_25_7]|nr:MAG: hypothetical protein BHW63_02995 [Mycoplasma sp. CAG:611_25_7]